MKKASLNRVVWLGIVAAVGTFGGCKGYTSLGDPPAAGAGGEGDEGTGGSGGNSTSLGGSSAATGKGGSGASKGGGSSKGGVGGTGAGATGGNGMEPTGGIGGEGAGATGGDGMMPTGGTGASTGGTAGTNPGDTGGTSPGGAPPIGPYEPRSGSFKMLGYSRTTGYRHDSISAGKQLLMQIAAEQGFEVKFTETNEDITLEGLSQYEVVFFINTTGDVFNPTEERAFEEWMTTKNGAFAGVHAATDTENGWSFYSEVTGQYHDLHETCCASDQIVIADDASDFPAFKGLPNPWIRAEEWFIFNHAAEWSQKPGFKILATHGDAGQPVTWVREFGNFRSFYTSLGHQGTTFQDSLVKKHLTGGILWTVRREHQLD